MPWDSNKAAITSIHMDSTVQPTNMTRWFSYCISLTSTNAVDWDVSQVTDMMGMFAYCWTLTSIDVSNWNTSAVTNMKNMFKECTSLKQITIGPN